eukprot:TRINITY_DN1183_c1_g2_i1.p1 TRINITY_DN1183_c1_g2~~TRINITY_DN1183_c1_g2_i1.p1  ORF type:complete len:608 (+),score=172.01 TRINITY_DN1183_c1_g2_i1:80-1903(+)
MMGMLPQEGGSDPGGTKAQPMMLAQWRMPQGYMQGAQQPYQQQQQQFQGGKGQGRFKGSQQHRQGNEEGATFGAPHQQLEKLGQASGLHIDRIPIDTLTRDVASTLSQFLDMEVMHIEDKRGQKTVHCCAFAVVKGNVDFQGKPEMQYELPSQFGVRCVPGTLTDGTEKPPPPRMIRIQPATRRPEHPPTPQPRCTLHIRIMTQRRNWAFSINGLTWAGLSCMLDLVAPGSAKNVILVADDTSEKTSQAHPENFICGFFVECVDVKAAEAVLQTCGDQKVIIDQVPFRIAAEYTRKSSLRLYDKPSKLRQTKQAEFNKVRQRSEVIAQRVNRGIAPGVTFPVKLGEPVSELNELFKFMSNHEIQRMPRWYQQRLHELGWTQPGMVSANDDILLTFLRSIKLEIYYTMLHGMGVMSYLDLATLDDQLLQQHGMDMVVHRRKLLTQIGELRHRVQYDPAVNGLPAELVSSQLPLPVHVASPPPSAVPVDLIETPLVQVSGTVSIEEPQAPAEEEEPANKAKMHRGKKGGRNVSMRYMPTTEEDVECTGNNRWTLPASRQNYFNPNEDLPLRGSLPNRPNLTSEPSSDDLSAPPALSEPGRTREDDEAEV